MYDAFPEWLLALIVIVSMAAIFLQVIIIIKFFQIAGDVSEMKKMMKNDKQSE